MKIKILLAVLLCIALALCFISCSDEDTENGGSGGDTGEKEYYTVSFVTNNGTTIEPVQVEEGKKASLPQTPEKAGYTFDGWYLGEEKWSFVGYTVTDDITLTAKWIANENTLVFDANGGEGTMENMIISTDASANLTANAFTRAGYHFIGWSTAPDGEVEYTDGTEYTMGTLESYTLYAIWEANDNNITFNGNGATSGSTSGIIAGTGEEITLTLNGFVRDNYTFKGWSTAPSGEVEYQDGANYTVGTDSAYTLYAVWEADVYTITYEKNGGTGKVQETFTVEDLPLTLKDLDDKEKFLFNCWYKESDFSGEPVFKIIKPGNITLYAEYIEGTYGLVLEEYYGEYTVTGYKGNSKEVVIPRLYKGKKITRIDSEVFYGCTNLTSMKIPSSIKRIGNYAFKGCTSLKEVYISDIGAWCGVSFGSRDANPLYYAKNLYLNGELVTEIVISNGVTSIGDYAFLDYTNLTSITIPDSVTNIGDYAFSGCTGLTSITIPNSVTSIGSSAFEDCTNLTSITIPFVGAELNGTSNTHFGYIFGAYSGVYNSSYVPLSLKKVIITGGKSIGESAFEGCASLTSVTIGDSVRSIGEGAFVSCTGLTSITIPNSVTSIGKSAFSSCTSLTSITIPNSVTSIGDSAFGNCTGLTSITIPFVGATLNGTKNTHFGYIFGASSYKGNSSYVPTSLKEVIITGGKSIGDSAFEDCTSLTSVTIPNSVTSIGSSAFYDCTNLTSITIPFVGATLNGTSYTHFGYIFGASSYGYNSKYVPTSLKEVIITGGNNIGYSAFAYCESLTSVTIPNSVTSIGYGAFSSCTGLTSITIPNSVTSIGYYAFSSCTGLTIYCEAESQPNGWSSSWNLSSCPVVWNCKNNDVADDRYVYTVIDGIRYALKNKVATIVRQPSNCKTANIPLNVTYKGQTYAITSIGSDAFSGCTSLTSVTIPNSVTSIGSSAFEDCTSLTSITIPNSVINIGFWAFYDCTSLTIYCEAESQPSGWSSSWNSSNRPVVWNNRTTK